MSLEKSSNKLLFWILFSKNCQTMKTSTLICFVLFSLFVVSTIQQCNISPTFHFFQLGTQIINTFQLAQEPVPIKTIAQILIVLDVFQVGTIKNSYINHYQQILNKNQRSMPTWTSML